MIELSANDIVKKIIELINEAYNPREARNVINEQYPEYNNQTKLKQLIPTILKQVDKKKQDALKKTQFFKYFLIGEDTIKSC